MLMFTTHKYIPHAFLNSLASLWLSGLGVLHLHPWKVCSFLHFWSNMATKAKDLLGGLLERSRVRVCRIAPSLWKAELSFLSSRECEQSQGYLIHSLSYPSAWTNNSCSAHPWEYENISQSSILRRPSVPLYLPQLHIPQPNEHLFNKDKSSVFPSCHRKRKNFPLPLLHLPLYPNLRTLQGQGWLSCTFRHALQSPEQAYLDGGNSCHAVIKMKKSFLPFFLRIFVYNQAITIASDGVLLYLSPHW